MKTEYTEYWTTDGIETPLGTKSIELPFKRVSARALVIRRKDGAVLGTIHNRGGNYALPGGGFENGEDSAAAVLRELAEENLSLINPDPDWQSRILVDYYDGFGELSIWHVIVVDGVEIGECDENIESCWIPQDQNRWHHHMWEHIQLGIHRLSPEYITSKITVSDREDRAA